MPVHRRILYAMHGLQTVTHIGQRPLHDDAHRVVEERFLQLVFDEAGEDAFADVRTGHEDRVSDVRYRVSDRSRKRPKSIKINYLDREKQRESTA